MNEVPVIPYQLGPGLVSVEGLRQVELAAPPVAVQVVLLSIGFLASGLGVLIFAVLGLIYIEERDWLLVATSLGSAAFCGWIIVRLALDLRRVVRFGYRPITVSETPDELVVSNPRAWGPVARTWQKRELRRALVRKTVPIVSTHELEIEARGSPVRIAFVSKSEVTVESLNRWLTSLTATSVNKDPAP